jgi:RNA polymerase sigma-70 factor (ECF subfamily)
MSACAIPAPVFSAARLGDRAAIASLLETTQPDIRRYARATCRTAADAEDADQEALWLLYRRVGTIRSLAALSAWLFTVVRCECLRLARRTGLVGAPQGGGGDEDAYGAVPAPEAELRLGLAAAIEALPLHYREVALMRDVKEMTIAEIAAALGVTAQTVKARLRRARLLMREYLAM